MATHVSSDKIWWERDHKGLSDLHVRAVWKTTCTARLIMELEYFSLGNKELHHLCGFLTGFNSKLGPGAISLSKGLDGLKQSHRACNSIHTARKFNTDCEEIMLAGDFNF